MRGCSFLPLVQDIPGTLCFLRGNIHSFVVFPFAIRSICSTKQEDKEKILGTLNVMVKFFVRSIPTRGFGNQKINSGRPNPQRQKAERAMKKVAQLANRLSGKRPSAGLEKTDDEVDTFSRVSNFDEEWIGTCENEAMPDLGGKILTKSRRRDEDSEILGQVPSRELYVANGGREAFLETITAFYDRLLDDPLMTVLFNETREERPPEYHAKLLGSFLLSFLFSESGYIDLVRSGEGHGLERAHTRAKNCPHRPEGHQGKGFTVRQRNAWIGHMHTASVKTGMNVSFRRSLVLFLARGMIRYSPFIDD